MWTGPHRVVECILNSYKLEALDRKPLPGDFNARQLREFVPREGTDLTAEQAAFSARLASGDDGNPALTEAEELEGCSIGAQEEERVTDSEVENDEAGESMVANDEFEEEEDSEDTEEGGIGTRVAKGRQGRQGGGWNRVIGTSGWIM